MYVLKDPCVLKEVLSRSYVLQDTTRTRRDRVSVKNVWLVSKGRKKERNKKERKKKERGKKESKKERELNK